MKPINHFIKIKYSLILGAMLLYAGCNPDDPDPDTATRLTLAGSGLENTRPGDYRNQAESGSEVTVDVALQSVSNLSKLVITKTINNEVDPTFGTDGTLTVDASGTSFTYPFSYVPQVADVDKLVGFIFSGTTAAGQSPEVVLTMVVTLSPVDNLPRRRWALTSVFHVNENEEAIKECQKDDAMLLNADSTMAIEYGTDTGAGDCAFDGFNVFTKWYITEEAETRYFHREYYGIFDPANTLVETFTIKTLTTETIQLEQTIDLSVFGGGTDETFIYTYKASPR